MIKTQYREKIIENEDGGVLLKENNQNINDSFTASGTNIDEVKRQNADSGLTYNQAKELLAKTTGSKDGKNNSVASFDYKK